MFIEGLEPHPSHDVISLDKYGSTFDGCAYCTAGISSLALTEPCPEAERVLELRRQECRRVAERQARTPRWLQRVQIATAVLISGTMGVGMLAFLGYTAWGMVTTFVLH